MPRKKLIRTHNFPYHVTGRCNNREDFKENLHYVWKIFNELFSDVTEIHGARIHAFVLMPNHFHLLISTSNDDLGKVMQNLMRSVTKILNRKSDRSGRVFGAKYHWTLISDEHYLDTVLKYIYRNPVRKNLIERAENYTFSSLNRYICEDFYPDFIFPPPGQESLIPNSDLNSYLEWINTPFKTEKEIAIRNGLKKTNFQL